MSNTSPINTFIRLLWPSGASVITSMFVSLGTVAVTMYFTVYKGGELEFYARLVAQEPNNLSTQLERLSVAINSSDFVGSLSVFVAWSILGLVIYALSMSIFHILRGGAMFVGTLRFLPGDQKPHLLLEVAERLLLRLLGVAGLYGLYKLTLLGAIPVVYVLQQLKIEPKILIIIISAVVTIAMTMVLMHVLTVMLRLITLRIRLLF